MKEKELTAVEWLIEQILFDNALSLDDNDMEKPSEWQNKYQNGVNLSKYVKKALKMEKEQKGYSEEEVIELLTQRCKYFGTSLSPFNKILLKQDLEWFEKFKYK
jgi:hypothetical protein